MPISGGVVALAALGLVALASSDTKKKKKKTKTGPTGPSGEMPPPGVDLPCGIEDLDATMPPAIKQAVVALLNKPNVDAPTYMAAGAIAAVNGFPQASLCLTEEAKRSPGPNTLPAGFDPTNPATWPSSVPNLGFPTGPMPPPPQPPPQPPMPPPMPPPQPPVPPQPPQPGPPQPQPPPPPPPPVPPPVPPQPPQPGGGGQLPWPFPNLPPGQLPFPIPNLPIPNLPIPPPPGGGMPTPPQPAPGGMTFTIRVGDRPYGLATYYTGDGMRFRELEGLNPQLGAFQGGSQPYPGWAPGKQILIPNTWQPNQKPIPPTGL